MEVTFFEKPGCINNTLQKRLLEEAGHTVIAYSLLCYEWEREELRAFFNDLEVKNWFNPSAPDINSGVVKPEEMKEEEALSAMLSNPLLIRRPLIVVNGDKVCGFQNALVNSLLNNQDVSHLQNCPNTQQKICD